MYLVFPDGDCDDHNVYHSYGRIVEKSPGVIGNVSELQHSAVVILKEGGMFLGIVMDLVSEIPNSYGRKSPLTGESMGALQVWANGMTLESYRNMVAGSYGIHRIAGYGIFKMGNVYKRIW